MKKEEDNYLGHFRTVEHKIPREEFSDHHIRRLQQDNLEENKEEAVVEDEVKDEKISSTETPAENSDTQ